VRRMIRPTAQISIAITIIILLWSCTAIPGINDETLTPIIRVPFVRVLLVESQDVAKVDAEGSVAIECLDKGAQTVYYAAQIGRASCRERV
jgi:hypothetical protein